MIVTEDRQCAHRRCDRRAVVRRSTKYGRSYRLCPRHSDHRVQYKLSEDNYIAMLGSPGGDTCDICVKPITEQVLVIDHDHRTGKVRGLLCNGCNVLLGAAYDNVQTLRKAIEYLERANNDS